MPISTRYLFTASMDVEPDKEALFNEVYDREHVPNLLKVPGVISVTRMTLEPLVLHIGGEERRIVLDRRTGDELKQLSGELGGGGADAPDEGGE